MTLDSLHIARTDTVTTLTLQRPQHGNRLTNEMAAALVSALDEAQASRVIVLRGAGDDFCLGRDMQPPPPGSGVRALDVLREDAGPMTAMYESFRRCAPPVLCAVDGRAWGIGLVFAALADLTVATPRSTFRLRELERGIPPCIAMAPLLDRMPLKALSHLVLTADELDAAAAQAAGIVGQVAATEGLDAAVATLVERVCSFPAEAVLAVKQYLCTAPRQQPGPAAAYGASLLANVLASR